MIKTTQSCWKLKGMLAWVIQFIYKLKVKSLKDQSMKVVLQHKKLRFYKKLNMEL